MLYARHEWYHPQKVKISLTRSMNFQRENFPFQSDGIGNKSQLYYDQSNYLSNSASLGVEGSKASNPYVSGDAREAEQQHHRSANTSSMMQAL